jgi:anthranilate phosphoribosyltransferase
VAGSGRKVIKHGNYGASSVSGASNVLENHGVKFTADIDKLAKSVEESGVAYLHAPFFSPALKSVAPARKALGIRNFFNLLGPLVNPMIPKHQLLGVYSLKMLRLYNYIAQSEGINCTIVHSLDGYDEISLTSPFKVSSIDGEQLFTPEQLGFKTAQQEELWGGNTIAEASAIFDNVLANTATEAQKSCVIANAAFAIHTLEPEVSLSEAIAQAKRSIESGAAQSAFKRFVEINA